jgi:hypothetical protein
MGMERRAPASETARSHRGEAANQSLRNRTVVGPLSERIRRASGRPCTPVVQGFPS